ncbi:TPA: restriction endonuclease subunit S [Clostridium perfringens]|nr:restriction endonuclease subunit S [Clostridium perfringens]
MTYYKKYDSYKNSSGFVEDIPSDWSIIDIKYLLSNKKYSIKSGPFGSQLKNDDMIMGDFKVYNQRNVLDNDFFIGNYYIENDKFEELKAFKVEYGDILITTRGTIGKAAIVPKEFQDGVLHPCLIKINLNEKFILNDYIEKIFNYTDIIFNQVNKLSNSTTIDVIYTETLKNIRIPIPSLEEQKKIVGFINKKLLEINSIIEEKEKLIELLKEKRKAIITEAITKGINKNVEMKYSGVEWIGNIPESFNKSKLKYLTNQIIDGTHNTPNYLDEGVPFLRVTDITSSQNNEIDLESVKFISYEEHKELIKRCKPEKGDLLVSKNGTIGIPRVVDWDYEFSIFVSLCLLKLKKDKIIPEYLSYFFNSDLVDTQIAYGGKKSTIVNLHLDKMREFIIFIPNIEEQIKIVNYLDEKVNNFDDLISQCKDECIILKEYKKSLITEAVTGKIDVRNKV